MNLFRPVGLYEMRRILESGNRAFPPRFPEQPIFYPVLNLEYARQISRQWNARSAPFGGYITQFAINDTYGKGFTSHIVGARIHEELWVPAEELSTFNQHIQPPNRMVEAYFGSSFRGDIPNDGEWANNDVLEQLDLLGYMADREITTLAHQVDEHIMSIILNLPFWRALQESGKLSDEDKGTLSAIKTLNDPRLPWHTSGFLEAG